MMTLYLSMAEKLIAHWRANNSAYPQKFVLTPAQRHGYEESCRMCGAAPKLIGAPKACRALTAE